MNPCVLQICDNCMISHKLRAHPDQDTERKENVMLFFRFRAFEARTAIVSQFQILHAQKNNSFVKSTAQRATIASTTPLDPTFLP
jgi:hypothetical protein